LGGERIAIRGKGLEEASEGAVANGGRTRSFVLSFGAGKKGRSREVLGCVQLGGRFHPKSEKVQGNKEQYEGKYALRTLR